MQANGFVSPPRPDLYGIVNSPLSTKKERKQRSTRSVPRLTRTAPAISRVYPRRYELQKPHFISFKSNSDSVLVRGRSYNDSSPVSYFEQCFDQERKIGEGSFGEVFRVRSKDDGRWYAVKRTLEPFRNASDRELKLREVQKHELLPKHPNLIEFVRAWEEKGRLYIQTELCEYSLSEYAEREHNIPEEQLWFYFADLVAAVNHLHDHDLLHLDIKPENIFVSREQICKLGDFGLIFDLKKDMVITAQEGDSKYLAPEILNEPPDKPADIFSLGITILELATDLDLPSRGDGWHMLRHGNVPDTFTNKLSPKLRHLIYWMMDPNPEKRPTAKQLLQDVVIQHYLSLRRKFTLGQVVTLAADAFCSLWTWLVYLANFMFWPLMLPIHKWKKDLCQTPYKNTSHYRAFFYTSRTPESPSGRNLHHHLVQRLRLDNLDMEEDARYENHHVHNRLSKNATVDSIQGESYEGLNPNPRYRLLFNDETPTESPTSSTNSSPIGDFQAELSEHSGSVPERVFDKDDEWMVKDGKRRRFDSPIRNPNHRLSPPHLDFEAGDASEVSRDSASKHFQRTSMTVPARRLTRTHLRAHHLRPLPRLDFSVLDSPERSPKQKRLVSSAKKSPKMGRHVRDRGSSADELQS